MDKLITYIEKNKLYKTAIKKELKYKMAADLKEAKKPMTYMVYVGDGPIEVVTTIAGVVETNNMLKRGDVLMTGPNGEQYVVSCGKFFKLYNVVDQVAIVRGEKRQVVKVTRALLKKAGLGDAEQISFVAPWGENMIANVGDYIVKDVTGTGVYRVESDAFRKTYKIKTYS